MKFNQTSASSKRSKRGTSLAELGPAAILTIPILLCIFEMAQLVNGAKMNDAAAAEAARVVSAGDPANAMTRAQVIIDHANKQSTAYGCMFTLISIDFNPIDTVAREAKMVPLGGMLSGDATVTTQLAFRPLGGNNSLIVVNARKTCPFSYNVPNTAGGQPVIPQ